ncbi:MAG: peptide chain release factor N(5)-glutamine methyltransferase [Micrococcales bacterium]
MKYRELVDQLDAQFAAAGIDSSRADAELLIAHCADLNRSDLAIKIIMDEELDASILETILELAARRAQREPLQHLTSKAYFRNLELWVGPGVFVPRPETESVTQLAIDALKALASPSPIAVDLATGSGAIALSLATEVPYAKVFAVELNPDSIKYTAKNFERYAAENGELREGDLRFAFDDLAGQVDVLISNPPYIPNDMIPIYPEVVKFDPAMALYGGADGLDLVREVAKRGQLLLKPGGTIVIEHADIQGEGVRGILEAEGFRQVTQHRDFNLRDRAVTAIR